MKQFWKIVVSAFAVILLLGTVNASAETYNHGYFKYRLEDGGVTITLYFGNEETVTVPNQISGTPVSKIAAGAFANCPAVKSVILPDTIMSVEAGAFGGGIAVDYSNTIWGKEIEIEESAIDPVLGEATQEAAPVQTVIQTEAGPLVIEDVTDQIQVDDFDYDEPEETQKENKSSPTPEPTVEPTAEPTEEPTATPEATPETETPAAEKSGGAIGWIIGAAVLVCGGAAVVLLRKKGGKA